MSSQEQECRQAYAESNFVQPRALYSSGDWDVEGIKTAIEACPPRDAEELASASLATRDSGNSELAWTYAKDAVETDRRSSLAYLVRGILFLAEDDHAKAEEDLRRSIELDPRQLPAYVELGLALHEQGKLDDARATWRKAYEVEPDYILAHEHLAVSYLMADDLESAAPHCRAALAFEEETDALLMCRGLARLRDGEYRSGVEDLSSVEGAFHNALDARYADEAYRGLAEAYLELGDPIAAARYSCEIQSTEPCPTPEIVAAIDTLRAKARDEATEGSYAEAAALSTAEFAKQLAAQAKRSRSIEEFVHPDIGVFLFTPFEWGLHRQTTVPWVGDIPLGLDDLRRARRLPKAVVDERNELGCGYPKNGIEPSDAGAFHLFFQRGIPPLDGFRLVPFVEGDSDQGFERADFGRMQRAALSVSHRIVYRRQSYEFGKIGERWYLLWASEEYDSEEDACG